MTNTLADLARMTTTAVGTSSPITLGSAVTGYLSFSGAGITDGQVVSYGIIDGSNRETGKGTYTASGTTLTRTVYKSTNSNSAISLSGAAEVFITGLAEDFQDVYNASIFGVLLPNAAFKHGIATALATGDTDLYTVPTGKRAVVTGTRVSGLNAAGSVTAFFEIKVSSTYYRINGNQTVTTAQIFNFVNNVIILEAAEKLSINCATNTGATAFYDVIEFDNTAPLFTKKLLGPNTGDTTLYTCPTGKSALVLAVQALPYTNNATIIFVSDGGGSRNWKAHFVPSGGSTSTANQACVTTSVSASALANVNLNSCMTAGDFFVVNVNANLSGTSAIAWINVVESPNT